MPTHIRFIFVLFLLLVIIPSIKAQWVQTSGPTGGAVQSIAVSDTDVFAGTYYGGVFLSTNYGTTWSAVNSGLTNTDVQCLAVSGANVFAGTKGGVFLSTDNGGSWNAANSGLNNSDVRSIAISGTNLFAGTYYNGAWKRPLSDMITAIERIATDLPTHFNLQQNYPNPFNPSTTMSYTIPKESFVTIKVYDLIGREIKTLVSENKPAGNYSVNFNGTNLPSGIYFYTIRAGSFMQTKKMVLLK